ncbi:MAG: hypothetical protein IAG10_24180 [Planctomycetaceae bacterium]|nr:hypothetical protein [Planctomycetaceae bacterium]
MTNYEMPDDEDIATVLEGTRTNLRERSPFEIEREVLDLSSGSTLDSLCAALDAADWLLARARTIDRLARQIAVAWIEKNGEFDVGPNHYCVGYAYNVRCLNIPQTANAVLEAAGGEIDRLFDVLVAQPFKHGSVRTLIGRPLHDKLFEARRTASLRNGVPERSLKRVDRRFLR